MVNVAGFENTPQIAQGLKSMVAQYGEDTLDDKDKFISLMNDCIPEYERERRLLKSVLNNGLLSVLRRESNQKFAITRAKDMLTNDMFLSSNAVEFVMVCFTYVFGWEYTPDPAEVVRNASVQQPVPAAPITAVQSPSEEQGAQLQVFRASDAGKFRLRGTVKVPEGYTMVDAFCFDGFSFMKNIELPSTLLAVGQYAFSDCKRLKAVTLPDSVRQIRQGAFNSCGKLMLFRIPEGVSEIEDNTFSFCYSLEIVELPGSITGIGSEAFAGCESLKKLSVPDSVQYIADDAFAFCNPMLTIRCSAGSYVHQFCNAHGLQAELIQRNGMLGA